MIRPSQIISVAQYLDLHPWSYVREFRFALIFLVLLVASLLTLADHLFGTALLSQRLAEWTEPDAPDRLLSIGLSAASTGFALAIIVSVWTVDLSKLIPRHVNWEMDTDFESVAGFVERNKAAVRALKRSRGIGLCLQARSHTEGLHQLARVACEYAIPLPHRVQNKQTCLSSSTEGLRVGLIRGTTYIRGARREPLSRIYSFRFEAHFLVHVETESGESVVVESIGFSQSKVMVDLLRDWSSSSYILKIIPYRLYRRTQSGAFEESSEVIAVQEVNPYHIDRFPDFLFFLNTGRGQRRVLLPIAVCRMNLVSRKQPYLFRDLSIDDDS